MTTLTRMIKNIKKAEKLIITPRIDTWLLQHPEGITWDKDAFSALEGIVGAGEGNEKRDGRFGASSRGTCPRRQVFSYLGMPTTGALSPVTVNLFNDGKWRHLRWQLMGLQAGVFTHVEHAVKMKKYNLKVSLDALNAEEGWIFELKGASNYLQHMDGVPEAHNLQIHTCLLATGWDLAVYVIESKMTQEWREIVVRQDPKIMAQVRQELEYLNECIEYQRLPPILPECHAKKGAYRSCPYNADCLAHQDYSGDVWPAGGWQC